ncbi:hypothetical protein NB717_001146 [Xanthomonas sacchari]|nr:hypothetical protein [Xanthomonas sacchari]
MQPAVQQAWISRNHRTVRSGATAAAGWWQPLPWRSCWAWRCSAAAAPHQGWRAAKCGSMRPRAARCVARSAPTACWCRGRSAGSPPGPRPPCNSNGSRPARACWPIRRSCNWSIRNWRPAWIAHAPRWPAPMPTWPHCTPRWPRNCSTSRRCRRRPSPSCRSRRSRPRPTGAATTAARSRRSISPRARSSRRSNAAVPISNASASPRSGRTWPRNCVRHRHGASRPPVRWPSPRNRPTRCRCVPAATASCNKWTWSPANASRPAPS